MHFTFDYFEPEMKKDPRIKVTREAWNDKKHFIQWDYHDQIFREHLPYKKAHEWCWDSYDKARDDILARDWRQLPYMEGTYEHFA